jgi:hypothetical protein
VLERRELLSKGEILQREVSLRAERGESGPEHVPEELEHGRIKLHIAPGFVNNSVKDGF